MLKKYHFWVGNFNSKSQFEEYFEEQFEIDEEPISQFAKNQNCDYYNHDFLERNFKEYNIKSEESFKGHSYQDQWFSILKNRLQKEKIEIFNSLIFIDSNQIKNPVSCIDKNYNLIYMGEIECQI